jgi:hypothetical protein
VDVEAFVVEDQILEIEETLHVLDFFLDGNLLFFYCLLDLLSLGEVDQVDDHVCEVVGHVSSSEILDDFAEDLVGFLGKGATLEHVAVHLLEV